MTEIVAGLVLVGGVILGGSVAYRLGLLSPSSVYIWFTTIDLAVFLIIFYGQLRKSDFTFTAMPWPPFDQVVFPVVLIWGLLILVGWVSTLGLRKREASNQTLEMILDALPKMGKNFTYLVAAFLFVVLWMEIFHFADLDKSLFWRNSRYLLLADPNAAGIQTLPGRWIHFLLPPLGLVLTSAGAFFWVRRRRVTALLFFLASIYPLLWAVAENSRWAPLYVAGALAVLFFFGNIRRHLFTIVGGAAFGFLLFIKVLIGRSTPYQGLGGTMDVFGVAFSNLQIQRWGIGFFLNVFQGAQDMANSLLLQPRFPSLYAWLSFSPTISAIDHFDQTMGGYITKIAPVVPMNAYAEAWFFGIPYFAFLLIVLVVWLRVMTNVFLRKDAIGIAFAVFSYWAIFFISQYPVRNSMRLIYVSLLIGIIVDRVLSARPKAKAEKPAALPALGAEGKAET